MEKHEQYKILLKVYKECKKKFEKNDGDYYYYGMINGIKKTLEVLEIEVDGINE